MGTINMEVNGVNRNIDQPTTQDWHILATLSAIPIIMVLGNSMIIPVLPTIGSKLQVSSFQTSLLITLFSIPAAIVIPIAGLFADRLGRKKVILYSLILYGIGGLLSGFASIGGSYLFLLISRIIQGIGAAGTAPITMVLTSDLYQQSQRSQALGIIEAANAMGKVLSPILGSLIAMIVWYAMFFAFPLFCIPVALALWFFIREPQKTRPPSVAEYKHQIYKIWQRQSRWLSVSFFAGLITMFTLFGVLFYFSDYLEHHLQMGNLLKGLILAVPLLGLCLTAYFVGKYVKEKTSQMKWLITIGLALSCIIMAILPFLEQFLILLVLLFLIGVGNGLVLPCLNTLITSAIGYQERGLITSLYSSIRFFGVALGPPIFGALQQQQTLLFLSSSFLLLISIILVIVFIRRPQRLRGGDDWTRLLLRKKRFHPVQ